ncbi:MAG: pilus assembly protein TadG-related protein [Pseudomonadota bacterium]
MGSKSRIRRFCLDEKGGAIMLVALSIFVLVGALGVALDSARGYTAQSKLQGAVDAAALAGAKAHVQHRDDASSEARMFFDANYDDDYMGGELTDFDAGVNEVSENMVVRAVVTIPTTFMQIFGFEEISLTGEAEVAAKHTNLELAVVVDVTGSMNWLDTSGDVKIESLRTAGATLLTSIFDEQESMPGVYLSLVPYRAAVNVGPSRTGWLRDYDASDFSPYGWRGCALARDAPKDQDDRPPNGVGNRFPPYHWPTSEWQYWMGWVLGPYDPNIVCPVNEVIPLTDQRETIEDGIEALVARSGGGTQTSQGLVWGWRTLSPRWRGYWGSPTPADMPLDYDEPDLVKAIVFMTDGIADIGWELMAYGFLDEGNLGTTNESLAEAEVNTRLAAICEAIKDEGIKIFSVMFAVSDPTIETTYRDCASDPAFFFNSATGDQLDAAFATIGRQLSSLRLTN